VIATLEDLDEAALVEILSEPKNALVKQYQRLFEMEDVRLNITEDALVCHRPEGHRAQDRCSWPALDHGRHPARHHVRPAGHGRRRGSRDFCRGVTGEAKPLMIYSDKEKGGKSKSKSGDSAASA
jgi:hypothetical protein